MRRLLLLGATVLLAAGGCQSLVPDGVQSGCDRVEATMCTRLVNEMASPAGKISSIAVRCATGSCNTRDGEVTITVGYSDGTRAVRNVGWDATALPPIGFPVVPTCEGIKIDACTQQAASSWTLGEEARIVAIHVRCQQGACGPDEGSGVMRVTFRDGTVREGSWAYAQAPEPAPPEPAPSAP